ncbi:TPA: hypothetical protein G8O67_004895 [Salmonella enterica]|uniref:Uncharacterized protein n=1 Tax=Salmonella enterica TaxID=28901 RepID=A0A756LAQ6_SALER|nr:hypothetical protein [Salmonella enterica]
MKLGAIWISFTNASDGKRYCVREQDINPNRSLLDDIKGPDDTRFIFFNDGQQMTARGISREIILEPAPPLTEKAGGQQ